MAEIFLRENESIEEALRRFKRICERAGIPKEIRKREFYKPPSVKKKEKASEMKRKDRLQARKQAAYTQRKSRPSR